MDDLTINKRIEYLEALHYKKPERRIALESSSEEDSVRDEDEDGGGDESAEQLPSRSLRDHGDAKGNPPASSPKAIKTLIRHFEDRARIKGSDPPRRHAATVGQDGAREQHKELSSWENPRLSGSSDDGHEEDWIRIKKLQGDLKRLEAEDREREEQGGEERESRSEQQDTQESSSTERSSLASSHLQDIERTAGVPIYRVTGKYNLPIQKRNWNFDKVDKGECFDDTSWWKERLNPANSDEEEQATLMPRSWIVRPGRERKTMKSKFERRKYKTTSPDSLGPRFDEYSPYQSSSFSVDLPIEYKKQQEQRRREKPRTRPIFIDDVVKRGTAARDKDKADNWPTVAAYFQREAFNLGRCSAKIEMHPYT